MQLTRDTLEPYIGGQLKASTRTSDEEHHVFGEIVGIQTFENAYLVLLKEAYVMAPGENVWWPENPDVQPAFSLRYQDVTVQIDPDTHRLEFYAASDSRKDDATLGLFGDTLVSPSLLPDPPLRV